jgi:hypothetical protein
MVADGAFIGRFGAMEHMTAVETNPTGLHVADKELILPEVLGEPLEPLGVDFLNGGNLTEMARNFGKTFLLRFLGESGVDVVKFIHFVFFGQLQQLQGLLRQVNGIVSGNGDVLTAAFDKMVIIDFRVLFFLPGGVEEDLLQGLQLVLTADVCRKGIAVPGLALSGERPQ